MKGLMLLPLLAAVLISVCYVEASPARDARDAEETLLELLARLTADKTNDKRVQEGLETEMKKDQGAAKEEQMKKDGQPGQLVEKADVESTLQEETRQSAEPGLCVHIVGGVVPDWMTVCDYKDNDHKTCIMSDWQCDGTADCTDESDEEPTLCACDVFTRVDTDTTYRYRYQTSSQFTVENFNFEVMAYNDVCVGLSPSASGAEAMYEIVIGGWDNTQSVIRRCKQCTNLVTVATPNILANVFVWRGFWITYDRNTGVIEVGKRGETAAFMTYTDPSPLQVQYVGLTTGWGSRGHFKLCHSDPTK